MASKSPHVCPWWFAYTFDNPLRRLIHSPERLFSAYLQPGMTALDFGCGMGHFSLGMARMVGAAGHVVAIDLQPQMLTRVAKRARRAKLDGRMETHCCEENALNWTMPVDFALACWSVHETPDPRRLLEELRGIVRKGGHFFCAEPAMHITKAAFAETIACAEGCGFEPVDRPAMALSHAAVFR